MKITVLGCGRWGSFLAWYSATLGHDVCLYGRETSENMRELREKGGNELLTLPANVSLSSDLEKCVAFADIIIISVSSQQLREFAATVNAVGVGKKPIVLCMKGLECGTGKRLTEVIQEEIPGADVSIWVGPGHVQDFLAGIPNCMVIDSYKTETRDFLVDAFSGGLIRFYYGSDILGNEIGAATKNIIGIAAGLLDGFNMKSLKGALMSRGTREIARLTAKMGGSELSAYGLCHLGDYEATLFSPYSHNRLFGELFAKKEPYGKLAEGVMTTSAVMLLGEKYGADLPICSAVNKIIHLGGEPHEIIADLFGRSLKNETEAL